RRRVRADSGPLYRAKQRRNRLAERFALDVPQRDVDAAERVQRHAAPTEVDAGAIHRVPQPLDLQRVPSDQNMPQSTCNGVGGGRLDDGLDHFGGRIDLADTDDARVGVYAHDQVILSAVGDALVECRLAQDDGLDVSDLHP